MPAHKYRAEQHNQGHDRDCALTNHTQPSPVKSVMARQWDPEVILVPSARLYQTTFGCKKIQRETKKEASFCKICASITLDQTVILIFLNEDMLNRQTQMIFFAIHRWGVLISSMPRFIIA